MRIMCPQTISTVDGVFRGLNSLCRINLQLWKNFWNFLKLLPKSS